MLLIALVLAIAGCGGTTIDGGELENEIKEDAEREGLVIDGVDCPSPDAETGDTFECTVTVKGEDKQLEVVQRNDDGNVDVRPRSAARGDRREAMRAGTRPQSGS